ncbi:MAG: four helix bundle protein [Balneolaceae bacterium]
MHNYKNLEVWKRSVELATQVYLLTNSFPNEEKYGLVSQIRRSAVSVSSNIAEGAGRNTDKDFALFLNYSLGSCFELETQLLISKNLDFIIEEAHNNIMDELTQIQKMLYTLIKKYS